MSRKTNGKVVNKTKRYHSDEEIKKLAQDMVQNQVFCSDQIKNLNHMSIIFMPLVFIKKKDLKKFEKDGVVHFYEYYSKAGPRGINGMPMFCSLRALTYADFKAVSELEGKIREAMKTALG